MMTDIQRLANSALQANEMFNKLYVKSITLMGASAIGITIECLNSQRKLVLVTSKEHPGKIGAAIASKIGGKFDMIGDVNLNELASSEILKMMEKNFFTGER